MKYKMVCIDMDGTLLNDEKFISDENKRMLKEISKKGIKVVICTGRIFVSAKYYASLIGEKVDIIAANGAIVIDKNENTLYYNTLGIDNGKKILKKLDDSGIYPHLYGKERVFTKKMVHACLSYDNMNKTIEDSSYHVKFTMVDEWDKAVEENEDIIVKLMAISDDLEKIKAIREEVELNPQVEVVYSHESNFEVMSKGVSKGNSIEILASHYGIDREEVIAFGDSNNDMSMIQYAGLGVAMGNATEEIKEIADFVTDTNNDNGVAKYLKKIFF